MSDMSIGESQVELVRGYLLSLQDSICTAFEQLDDPPAHPVVTKG